MSEIATKLLPALDQLSLEDKVQIAERLLASIPEDEEEEAFIAELNRRAEAFISGKEPGIPAEEVFKQLREKYQ